MKREKLVNALTLVINAIEQKTVVHNWQEPGQCNMGLVAQVLLEKSAAHISKVVLSLGQQMPDVRDEYRSPTWNEVINFFCPLSGLSNVQIIKTLQESGLSRDDIAHLENLSDPEILKRSGIETKKIIKSGLFTASKTEEIEDYYRETENLLKYIKTWKKMLQEES